MQRVFLVVVAYLLLANKPGLCAEPIKIVTTTTVLASLAEQIAGEDAEVFSIASPKRDIHKITPTPKDVLKTRKADIFIYHGLQLEVWLQPLLNASGRREFLDEGGQAIDASLGVKPLEVPHSVNRLEGDIHPFGNPHYWLDPVYGKLMAQNISQGLSRLYPEHAAKFESRAEAFQKKLESRFADWRARMQVFEGMSIVTYHRSWSYFVKAFNIKVVGEIEPKPGIPVTSKHLSQLQALMKQNQVRLIITEPYQNDKPSKKLSRETGAKVAELLQFSRAQKGVDDYIDLMEYNVAQIEKALGEHSRG